MAEAGGLNPLQHGFESHRGHALIASLAALAGRGSRPQPPTSSSLADGKLSALVLLEHGGARSGSVALRVASLLLQIGGANIAGADRAWQPPSSLSLRRGKNVSARSPPKGGARSGLHASLTNPAR